MTGQEAPITAFTNAKDNAELIEMCVRLGYLKLDMPVWDCTYGYGKFWTRVKPEILVASDIDPAKSPPSPGPWDFTKPTWQECWYQIVFDPPYKLNGTPTAAERGGMDERYGVHTGYMSIEERHNMIRQGITALMWALKVGGMLFIKCQDQVASGMKHWQTIDFTNHAVSCGGRLVDMLHLPGGRSQPEGTRQLHSRQNYSTLLIVKKVRHVDVQ